MAADVEQEVRRFMEDLVARHPAEPEFHQAVHEVASSVIPFVLENPQYRDERILERLTEPDRVIMFRVCWVDDQGCVQINRGYRVQYCNAIGPYKGGLRFHPTVNLSVLKFLGFEQIFKNSLTTLPLGGAKGGSDFDPAGKSDREVMRFCQAFMAELAKHIGPDVDVPAGDIGVGAREIGYMFGVFKRVHDNFVGAITGKGLEFGGSLIRREATGYGSVYFCREMLGDLGESLKDKRCVVSGSGNVAQYTAQKLIQLGAKVLTLSDSSGFVYFKDGMDLEQLEWIQDLKNIRRGRIAECVDQFGCEYFPGERPWRVTCDVAFPSATQNELELDDAKALVSNGCLAVCEGANMPTTLEATKYLQKNNVLFAPGKAANAGGVAVSGLEMTQNSIRMSWSHDELDRRLQDIMKSIHNKCAEFGGGGERIDFVKGANIAGFKKVADALLAYGVL